MTGCHEIIPPPWKSPPPGWNSNEMDLPWGDKSAEIVTPGRYLFLPLCTKPSPGGEMFNACTGFKDCCGYAYLTTTNILPYVVSYAFPPETVSVFNRLVQWASSHGNRAYWLRRYCHAELAVSSPAMAIRLPTMARLSGPGWLDYRPRWCTSERSPISVLTRLDVD